ncbi:MAG TPA: outer membrane protein [Pseudolabrys sp.]|nr:outer membrane protein [Pseudolabrys sp.]
MKKIVLSVLAGLAGFAAVGAAQSADLERMPVKAAPAARAVDWTGFYLGVQGGGGWASAHQRDPFPFDSGWYDLSGALAGVTFGYNWQIGNTVVGFESDAAWSNIRGSTTGASGLNGPCGGNHCESELQWFGTGRLRLGYAVDRWLPYVTGGMAWGYIHGAEGTTPAASGIAGSGAESHYGWTVGGGLEGMIDRHWSAKIEYLYADLRNGRVFMDRNIAGTNTTESIGMHVHVVRAGLNYKFEPGPSFLPVLPPNPGPSAGPWNWSGLYAGVNFGGGAGRASQSDALFNRGSYDVSGALGGATLGYNWQRERFVFGVEGDIDYSSIKGATGGVSDFSTPVCSGSGFYANCDSRLRWLGTVRARVGYAWDRLLPYVTGGLAVGSLETSEGSPPISLFGSGTNTRTGWTAGAGLEARIDDRWSSKLEYLYVDLGSHHAFNEQLGPITLSETVGFRSHIVRAGLNYRFN